MRDLVKVSEIIGAATGISASLMIALNLDLEVAAFIIFIISDLAWIYVGIKKQMKSLFYMSIFFAIVGAVGIFNWI